MIGIAIAVALGVGRQAGPARWVGRVAAVTELVGGFLMVKTLIGV